MTPTGLRTTPSVGNGERRANGRAISLLGWLAGVGALVILLLPGLPGPLANEPDVFDGTATGDPVVTESDRLGTAGPSYQGTGTPTGSKRGESMLWWNDGMWWANMWNADTQDFHIFRLDLATQTWVSTSAAADWRPNTHADVLSTGTKLYIASHRFVKDNEAAALGFSSYLFRYSYHPDAKRYSLDDGFPNEINNHKVESLVIDRDSTGAVWATWQQDGKIYLNRTAGPDDVWGTPFPMPGGDVTIDDTSAVLAIGDRLFAMWSDQSLPGPGMYYGIHIDGAPADAWSPKQAAISGPGTADDHLNLKWLDSDGGRVFATVKTSFRTSSEPLVMLLVFDVARGTWTHYPIASVADCPNRVIVVVDEEHRTLYTYGTYPSAPAFQCRSAGGAIYRKSTPLDSISFPAGAGELVIADRQGLVQGVASTKQNADAATGIAVLADNPGTQRYWYDYASLSN